MTDSNERSRAAVWAAGLGLVALALLAAVLSYRFVSGQVEAREDVERAGRLLARVDRVIEAVDEAIRGGIPAESIDRMTEVAEKIAPARQDAEEASEILRRAAQGLRGDERSVAERSAAAAEDRALLLSYASPVLDAALGSAEALGPARDGWALLLEAEGLADESVELYNSHRHGDVTDSRDLAKRAAEKVSEAETLFRKAEGAFDACDMKAYIGHLSTRAELLDLGVAACDAWLSGKIGRANGLSERYNDGEQAASKEAGSLEPPEVEVARAFEAAAGEDLGRYLELRARLTGGAAPGRPDEGDPFLDPKADDQGSS